ncbi:MAG: hypothetical protein O3B13_21315 [Planctomycetota bacterium]|nr:hypothetical protein [Planctomycetota bacterium]
MVEAWRFKTAIAIAAVLMTTVAASAARCCPFCSAPSLTMAEQLAQADAAVLVQWVGGTKATDKSAGETVYEIRQIVRNHKGELKIEDRVTLPRYRESKVGDLFLLVGSKGASIEWGSPLEVTETSFNYVAQAPSPEVPVSKRLVYYVRFLEYPDQMIANDAYGEFANAPYADITQLSDKLPREKIRGWITNPQTPATRMGLYGLLIGLCGTEEDAGVLEAKILEKTDDFRLGIDGLMSGYLLLRGEKGLSVLDNEKLKNRDVPFSETYAAMQALRFMERYSEGRIEKARLRESMRILLERPELADLVIADLARWKDWGIQDRLMDIYVSSITNVPVTDENQAEVTELKAKASKLVDGKFAVTLDEKTAEAFSVPSIKRAIVRYMLVSSKDLPDDATSGEDSVIPEYVSKGRSYVEILRELDPKTVSQAERFFFLK